MRETKKTAVTLIGIPADIQTQDLPNTSPRIIKVIRRKAEYTI
jgi:hypothetical protein